MAWLREEQPDVAAAKILEAADKAFTERGVAATGMATVAEFAGCSRGTLYRYFESLHGLHLAYVDRTAREIVDHVREATRTIEDPRERVIEAMLASIAEVRARPGAAAWFEPGVSGNAARISRSSEVVDAFMAGFATALPGDEASASERDLRARWLERVIVSLLSMPGEDEAEERLLVERFATAWLGP